VLKALKADARLRHIPVIVLGSSEAPEDILHAYDHLASCFVPKPPDKNDLKRVLRTLEDFWFTVAKLPGT
jgi:two-component system response regulator